jgi:hypothetical protein
MIYFAKPWVLMVSLGTDASSLILHHSAAAPMGG